MSKKKDRSTSNSILRVMLKNLPKEELIENLIGVINSICETEEDLKRMRHHIITYVHARKIILGKSKLEDYEEPHRSELEEIVKRVGMVL